LQYHVFYNLWLYRIEHFLKWEWLNSISIIKKSFFLLYHLSANFSPAFAFFSSNQSSSHFSQKVISLTSFLLQSSSAFFIDILWLKLSITCGGNRTSYIKGFLKYQTVQIH
jgi:hypothetical protein